MGLWDDFLSLETSVELATSNEAQSEKHPERLHDLPSLSTTRRDSLEFSPGFKTQPKNASGLCHFDVESFRQIYAEKYLLGTWI